MTPAERELFRQRLIAALAAVGSVGIKLPVLLNSMEAAGFTRDERALRDELDYLQGKRLAEPMDKLISPENPRWKITAAGRDYAAQEGLA